MKIRWCKLGAALVALFGLVALSAPPAPFARALTATMGPVNKAKAANVAGTYRTFSSAVGDFNKDGRRDAFVVPHDPQSLSSGHLSTTVPHLFKNVGGSFVDVANPARFSGKDRHGCAWGDANQDGRPDLACAVGLTGTSVNELGIQQSGGTFVNRAAALGITAHTHGRYRTVSWLKANGDQWPDLYFARYYGSNNNPTNPSPAEDPPYPNELWINHGGTSFTRDDTNQYGLENPVGAPKNAGNACNQPIDYDGDGRQDLLVCGLKHLILYRNTSAGFVNINNKVGINGFSIGAELRDLNRDGHPDLVRDSTTGFRIRYFNPATGGFGLSGYSMTLSAGQGLDTGDFNGDGKIDIYVLQGCSKTSLGTTDKPDYVLLGEAGGTYARRTIPALARNHGCGDAVSSINYDQDGKADFLVLNGHNKMAGPVQLWSWKPLG